MKKFIFALATMVIAFVSCQEKENFGMAELKADIASFDFENAKGGNVTFSIKATRDWTARVEPATEGVTVDPMSGSASDDYTKITVTVGENKGKTRNFNVVLSAAETKDVIIKFTQPGQGGISISDIAEMEVDAPVSVEGLVVAAHERGCIIQDATGRALVFDNGAKEAYATIGKTAKIEGKIAVHTNGVKQIVPAEGKTLYTETDAPAEEVKFPENATVITKDNYGSIEWTAFEPVKIDGVCAISGVFVNINFGATDGSNASASFPLKSFGFENLNGKNVSIEGYTVGISGGKHHQIMVTKVTSNGEAETENVKISDIYDEAKVPQGTMVTIEGTVVALHQRGFFVKDDTGIVYVFEGEVKDHLAAAGNKVTIAATKADYFGAIQLTGANVKANDNSTAKPDHGSPVKITDVTEAGVGKDKGQYIEVEGEIDSQGRNIIVNGQKAIFNWTIEDWSAYGGKKATVRAYTNGSRTQAGVLHIVPVEIIVDNFVDIETRTYSVNPTETKVDIAVKSNTKWTVACSDNWIKNYTKEGSNDGVISVEFDANSGAERTATLTVSAGEAAPITVTITQKAAGQTSVSYTALFLGRNNSASVGGYTETFDSTNDGFTVTLQNWNNNKNGWDYIKAGRKSDPSVATITTKAAINDAIKTVTVTVTDLLDVNKIKSNKLEVASDPNFATIIETVDNVTVAKGEVTYTVSKPTANCYYRLTYDMDKHGSKNGIIAVSKVVYAN